MNIRRAIAEHTEAMQAHAAVLRGLHRLVKLGGQEEPQEAKAEAPAEGWSSRRVQEIACSLCDLEFEDGNEAERWVCSVTLPRKDGEGDETLIAWGTRQDGYDTEEQAAAAWEALACAHGALDPRTLEVRPGWHRKGDACRVTRKDDA